MIIGNGNSGQAYTGWFLKGGTWYYADPQTAKVATGFQTINGTEYYLTDMLVQCWSAKRL